METGYLLSFKASPLKDYLVVLTHLHDFFDTFPQKVLLKSMPLTVV